MARAIRPRRAGERNTARAPVELGQLEPARSGTARAPGGSSRLEPPAGRARAARAGSVGGRSSLARVQAAQASCQAARPAVAQHVHPLPIRIARSVSRLFFQQHSPFRASRIWQAASIHRTLPSLGAWTFCPAMDGESDATRPGHTHDVPGHLDSPFVVTAPCMVAQPCAVQYTTVKFTV